MWIGHRKEIRKADVSRVSPSSDSLSLRWPIHIANPVDQTNLSYYKIPIYVLRGAKWQAQSWGDCCALKMKIAKDVNTELDWQAMLTRITRHHEYSFSVPCISVHYLHRVAKQRFWGAQKMGFVARHKLPCLHTIEPWQFRYYTPLDKCFAGRVHFRFSFYTYSFMARRHFLCSECGREEDGWFGCSFTSSVTSLS